LVPKAEVGRCGELMHCDRRFYYECVDVIRRVGSLSAWLERMEHQAGSRDNAVGIETGYGLDKRDRSSSPGSGKIFLFTLSRPVLGPT
jgi:hypothetical protein